MDFIKIIIFNETPFSGSRVGTCGQLDRHADKHGETNKRNFCNRRSESAINMLQGLAVDSSVAFLQCVLLLRYYLLGSCIGFCELCSLTG
jgi:hypothetical protein